MSNRTVIPAALAAAIAIACCSGKHGKEGAGGQGSVPTAGPPADPAAPKTVIEASLDLAEGGRAPMDGNVVFAVAAGSGPSGSSATARIASMGDLPPAGSAIRLGPVVEVSIPGGAGKPVYLEIPIFGGDLPGGLGPANVFAAVTSGAGWREVATVVLGAAGKDPSAVASIAASGTVALLADGTRRTPIAGSSAIAFLALAPAILGPGSRPSLPPATDQPAGGPIPLYVLEKTAGEVAIGGREYEILETKSAAGKSAPPLAVRRNGGGFLDDDGAIATVLAAHAVRSALAGADRKTLASLLSADAAYLGASLASPPDLGPLEALAGTGEASGGAGADPEESWEDRLAGETLASADASMACMEIWRARLECARLAEDVSTLDTSAADGDLLLSIAARMDWILGRLDSIHDLAAARSGEGQGMALPWSPSGDLLAALSPIPAGHGKKAPAGVTMASPPEGNAGSAAIEALAISLRQVDPTAPSLASLLSAGASLLPSIAALPYGRGDAPDWAGLAAATAMASEIAAMEPRIAPPPDTSIQKFAHSSGSLSVVAGGTDEDGRITGFKWWFDDGLDPHVIKGKGTFKAGLGGLKSGAHEIWVAAIDDDGQKDPTAARLSFYVRRSVEIGEQGLALSFDAQPWNVNSEHARSVKSFVRKLEGPVQECADTHYRWGIDGAGRVTVSFKFGAGQSAGVAKSVSIEKDTFKNQPLAGCIRKAVKIPRVKYNQEYRPAATVTVTFVFKPFILFFDAASLGDVPGPDVMGAALWQKCTAKGQKKAEAWCDGAVKSLPGPWDAGAPWEGADGEEGGQGEGGAAPGEDAGDPGDVPAGEAGEEGEAAAGEEETGEEISEVVEVIPPPEFDAVEVHGQCIEESVKTYLGNCTVHLTKKRSWCVDSCIQQAAKCDKQCGKAGDWGEDPWMCAETCWTEEAWPCAENCAIKGTPFEKQAEGSGGGAGESS